MVLGPSWLKDNEAVFDLRQNLLIGLNFIQTFFKIIEKAKNFKVCLKLSPKYFIYMTFPLSICGQ